MKKQNHIHRANAIKRMNEAFAKLEPLPRDHDFVELLAEIRSEIFDLEVNIDNVNPAKWTFEMDELFKNEIEAFRTATDVAMRDRTQQNILRKVWYIVTSVS